MLLTLGVGYLLVALLLTLGVGCLLVALLLTLGVGCLLSAAHHSSAAQHLSQVSRCQLFYWRSVEK